MKMHSKQILVWPDPIIGYRLFPGRFCRAIFEDSAGQYVMTNTGERFYGVYLTREAKSSLPALLSGIPFLGKREVSCLRALMETASLYRFEGSKERNRNP